MLKSDFPILSRRVNGKRLVYLDNAATSQKPQEVVDAILGYYETNNANVHRGIYTLSEEATDMYEEVRTKVQKFLNARLPSEIIFTANATASLNLAAFGWGARHIKPGDVIAVTEIEHHSNLIPWQVLAKQTDASLEVLPIDDDGLLAVTKFSPKTKILAISHASNVLGTIQPLKEIVKAAHKVGALVCVDGAQAAPHMKVDVQSLDCDFYAISAHKMLGPTGIGALYVEKEVMEEMGPTEFGGGMIRQVSYKEASFDEAPGKFEAGTPNVADAVGFGAALDYLIKVGMEKIRQHEIDLTKYAFERLQKIPDLRIYGTKDCQKRTGLVSFSVEGVHPHDIASVLDVEGVAVRSGHHCAMPLHKKLGLPATTRASFYFYNDKKDIDVMAKGMEKAIKILK